MSVRSVASPHSLTWRTRSGRRRSSPRPSDCSVHTTCGAEDAADAFDDQVAACRSARCSPNSVLDPILSELAPSEGFSERLDYVSAGSSMISTEGVSRPRLERLWLTDEHIIPKISIAADVEQPLMIEALHADGEVVSTQSVQRSGTL